MNPFARFYVICIAGVTLGPFVPLVIASFAFRWVWPDLLPSEWWWQVRGELRRPVAWDYLFTPASGVLEALYTTFLIALLATLLAALLALPAARALATRDFRGKTAVELFLLTPLIIPELAVGLGILVLFLRLGLAGSLLGVVLAHLIPTLPYMTRILTSSFQTLDTELESQARTLGATPVQVFWRVTLPLLAPGLVAGMLFSFLVSSNVFLLTFFVGRGSVETLPTLLFSQLSGGGVLDPVAAGLALLTSLPGIILLLFAERFLSENVLLRGVGG